MENSAPTQFFSYGNILHALEDAVMTVVRQVAADEASLVEDGARNFSVLSAILRRSIVVSMQLEERHVLDDVPRQGVMARMDRELVALAARKIDAAAHRRMMDAMIDAEDDDFSELPRRSAARLVVELCRDFGMLTHAVPQHFLENVPSEIRLLAARAAAAGIRPGRAGRPGRAVAVRQPAVQAVVRRQ